MASLRSSNGEPDVSALGQKQTFAVQNAMSALLSVATAKADSRFLRLIPKSKPRQFAPAPLISLFRTPHLGVLNSFPPKGSN